jgi:hypothetical protein
VLRVERIEGNRIVDKPERVRLSVRRGLAPPAGAFVEVKAQLNPPLPPLRPGSYDFARDLLTDIVRGLPRRMRNWSRHAKLPLFGSAIAARSANNSGYG